MRGLFLLELGAVFVALTILARVARRLSFSPIPFYLGLGLLLGEHGVLPLDLSRDFIGVGAELGAILLLFLLGVEYSVGELLSATRRGYPAGVVDLVLNFSPGFVMGLILGWSVQAAFLLGGVTYISSSGIAAKLLRDLGWLGNRETPAVLSVLVIEDLVMAVFLAIAAGAVLSGGAGIDLWPVLGAVAVVGFILAVAHRYGDQFSRAVFSRSEESTLLGLLGVVLVVSGLAERFHVSAAVGAFLVGLAVSGGSKHGAAKVLGPLRDLFGAAFFLFFGLQVDPGGIPDLAVPAAALVTVAAVTKVISGRFAAGRLGASPVARRRAGSLLIARGEFSIIIAELGVEGEVEAQLAPMAAAVVVGLAMLGPVMVRLSADRPSTSEPRSSPATAIARPSPDPYATWEEM